MYCFWAQQVVDNCGIDVAKMDAKLLQKIEELNLYVIKLEKENKRQDELIEGLLKKLIMKNGLNVLLIFLLAIVLLIASCKKKQCYHCYSFEGTFKAALNGDTLVIGYMQSSVLYRDSISHYASLGYVVVNGIYQFNSDPSNGAMVCDTNFDYPAITIHDSCSQIN